MTSKKVSALKFVGTVSVGLLTGVSYTLSTVAAPALLALPSASSASSALASLASASRAHLTSLSALSTTAFALAFALSPRSVRHPYLLYTSLLAAASTLATPHLAPLLLSRGGASRKATPAMTAPASPPRATRTERGMDASYEVLGEVPSSATSASGEDENTPSVGSPASSPGGSAQQQKNGEEVRAEVKAYAGAALVQAGLAAMSFAISVVGIWGDGASQVAQVDTVFKI